MIDVVMPQLGESVAEGTVTKWLVREGDMVTRQQPIVVVSTDKADTEVTSTATGRVAKLVAAGELRRWGPRAWRVRIPDRVHGRSLY